MIYDPEQGFIAFDAPAQPEATDTLDLEEDTLATAQAWNTILMDVYARACCALPEVGERLEKALEIVQAGGVTITAEPHTYLVTSGTDSEKRYRVNAECPCADYAHGPGKWCKHKLAVALYIRTIQQCSQKTAREETAPPPSAAPPEAPPTLHPDLEAHLLERYTYETKGVKAIRYVGLLLIAKGRGLTSLQASWVHNDDELSLAQATATFADGTTWVEAGDATPTNVLKMIAPHFRRMALTRAKARTLRDALGIDMVAFEELGEL